MKEVLTIIEAIANEKGLKLEDVKEIFSDAIKLIAQNVLGQDAKINVSIYDDGQNITIDKKVLVIADDSDELDDNSITLTEAKEIDNSLEVGDSIKYPYDIQSINRTDLANLYKYMETNLQKYIEDNLYEKFIKQQNRVISGVVTRVDEYENTYIEIEEIKGILKLKNRIKGESFSVGDTVKSLVKNVYVNKKDGIYIELSRTAPKFLEELLTINTPEIEDGTVRILKSARIPGIKAKVLLESMSDRVDPVGSAVGVKGVRINSLSSELNGERIDCINYVDNKEMLVAKLLSPAIVSSIVIEDDIAIVSIKEDQKAKAIGKKGTNIKLAKLITGMDIELREIEGTTEEPNSEYRQNNENRAVDNLKNLFD